MRGTGQTDREQFNRQQYRSLTLARSKSPRNLARFRYYALINLEENTRAILWTNFLWRHEVARAMACCTFLGRLALSVHSLWVW